MSPQVCVKTTYRDGPGEGILQECPHCAHESASQGSIWLVLLGQALVYCVLPTAACLWMMLVEARLTQAGHPITECWNPAPANVQGPPPPPK